MDKHFCIGTLTYDGENRAKFLELTINTFLESTNIPQNLDWFIFLNGSLDSEVGKTIEKLEKELKNKISIKLICFGKNLGVGAGINGLNEYLKEYKYSLFLEDDWVTIPQSMSGYDNDWLNRCLDEMESHDIDQLQLRKYQNDVDDRQYGLGYWTRDENIDKIENDLVFLNKREYTNNPHIRKNQTYFDLSIFPLNTFFDSEGNAEEIKGNPYWGQAEILAEPKGFRLKSAWLKGGNMLHCDQWDYGKDWEKAINELKGCDWNTNTKIKCKYGFTFPREQFCNFCDKTKDFTDLEKHNQIFEQSLR